MIFKKSIEAVLGLFDFSVCQAGFDFEKSEFVTHDNFIYDLSKRELVFNKDSTAGYQWKYDQIGLDYIYRFNSCCTQSADFNLD